MPTVRVTGGYLRVARIGRGHPDQGLPGGEAGTDPDYGVDEGAGIDNGLPGGGEYPSNGLPPLRPDAPNQGLPRPPPGVFPPLTPSHPIQPVRPDRPVPPGTIWPPIDGGERPDQGLPGGGGGGAHPDQGLPAGGGERPDQGLPGGGQRPSRPVDPGYGQGGTFWIVAGIPGVGWRYVCVDPSLKPGMPLPLPPTPQPK